jgi:hypothetical protein
MVVLLERAAGSPRLDDEVDMRPFDWNDKVDNDE